MCLYGSIGSELAALSFFCRNEHTDTDCVEWLLSARVVCRCACVRGGVCDHTRSWHRSNDGKDHAAIDVAIAVDHLTLAAAEVGLGTCWVCNFDAKRCAAILHLPADVEPVVLVPMGYAAAGNVVPTKKRKLPEELFTFV